MGYTVKSHVYARSKMPIIEASLVSKFHGNLRTLSSADWLRGGVKS